MNKVRTIVIDGVEIQTSLSAVEIASLPIKCAELKQENQELKEKIDVVYEERTYLYNKLSMENKQLISKLDRYDAIVEERDKYKEVIDKAIEYLEQPYRDNFDYSKSQLLEILEGSGINEEKERLQLENELLMTCSKAQAINKYIDALEENSKLSELWCDNRAKIRKLENQQKEFIEYMNKTIEELECDDVSDEEMKGYLIQRIDTFKEILQKYKEKVTDINVGSIGDERNEKLNNQQKEFIEWLTSYIELLNNKPDLIEESKIDLLKEILSKYKETIGDKDE